MPKNQTYYIERKKSLWEKIMGLICQWKGHSFKPLLKEVHNNYALPDKKCHRCGEETLGGDYVVVGYGYDWDMGDGFFLRIAGSKHTVYQRIYGDA